MQDEANGQEQSALLWRPVCLRPGSYSGTITAAKSEHAGQSVSLVAAWFQGVHDLSWIYPELVSFAEKAMGARQRRKVKRRRLETSWGLFHGDHHIYSDSACKVFASEQEAETHRQKACERLRDSASLSRYQWELARVRQIKHTVTVHSVEDVPRRSAGVWEFRGALRIYQNGKLRLCGKWTKMSLYPGRFPATQPRRRLLALGALLLGKREYMKGYVEGDRDYLENNREALVRFLDVMNGRRGKG